MQGLDVKGGQQPGEVMRVVTFREMEILGTRFVTVRGGKDKYGKGEVGINPVVLDGYWKYQRALMVFNIVRKIEIKCRLYLCICVCIHIYAHIYKHCMCIYIYVHTYIYIHICTYICK